MREKKKNIKNSGFKVPDQYFENFEKQLSNALDDEKENGFLLSKVEKTGYKVPDQYFETFEDILLTKIKEKKKTTKVISIATIKKLMYISGVAAMIVLAIILRNPKETNAPDFESIAIADIQEYIISNHVEMSDDELAVLLDSEIDLTEMFEDAIISNEVLEDYLSTEDLENDIYIE